MKEVFFEKRWFLQSACLCLFASLIVGAGMVALKGGFGIGDLSSLAIFSLPFAVLIGLTKTTINSFYKYDGQIQLVIFSLIVGVVAGVLWTLIVRFFLGEWFLAFSFPPVFCWMAGGFSGLAFSDSGKSNTKFMNNILVTMLGCLVFIAVSTFSKHEISTQMLNEQKLEVVFIEHQLEGDSLSVEKHSGALSQELNQYAPSDAKINALFQRGLRGTLTVVGTSVVGKGKLARATIIMQKQIDKEISLAQPDGVSVIYFQDGDDWKSIPENFPKIDKLITLKPNQQYPSQTMALIERVNGSKQGQTAFSW